MNWSVRVTKLISLFPQDLDRDIKNHQPNHTNVNESTTIHLDVCSKEPVDEPISEQKQVASELENFNTRWDKLKTSINDSTQQLEAFEEEVNKLNDKKRTLEDLFNEVDKELDEQKPVNVNPNKCQSNLDNIKVSMIVAVFIWLHLK